MQTTQSNLGPLERRIEMSVPVSAIDEEAASRLKSMARTVKMPGFRPGKVPMNIVAKQYGPQARSEAIDSAVNKVFAEKLREANLRMAGYPRIEEMEGKEGDQLTFAAIFEVYPEIKLNDLASVEVKRPSIEVTAAEVDKTIDVLRQQRSSFVDVERAAADGDRVTVDFLGKKDGVPFEGGTAEDYAFVLGGGTMLVDFETAAKGLSAGSSRTFDLTFPADYHAKHLAGQTVQFEITMKAVSESRKPELDAEFAKSMGINDGTVEALRTEIETNLKREVTRRLMLRTKETAFDALLEANPVDAPKALVDTAAQNFVQNARQDMAQRGIDVKKMPIDPSWFTDKAIRQVKLGLLLSEVVKSNDLYATPEQVREMVEDFAQSYQEPQELINWYYSEPGRLREVESAVAEENVVKWILNHAKTVETPISFDELMGAAA